MLSFYFHVEEAPIFFLIILSNLFFNDLYDIDEKKINQITERIALRMEKEKTELLIKKIQEKY